MKCEEVMKRDPCRLAPDDPAAFAAMQMESANVGFLPVCDAAGIVIGTVTDRDLATRVLATRIDPETPVRQIMTRDVITCRPADDLRAAERRMAIGRVSRVVCTDETGHLVGVISLSDIALHDSDRRVAQTLREVADREVSASTVTIGPSS